MKYRRVSPWEIHPTCFGRGAQEDPLLKTTVSRRAHAGGRPAAGAAAERQLARRDGRGSGRPGPAAAPQPLCLPRLPRSNRHPGPGMLTDSISINAALLSPGGRPVTAACHRRQGRHRQSAPARQGHRAGRAQDWLRRRGVLLLSDLIGGRGWSPIKQRKGPGEGN